MNKSKLLAEKFAEVSFIAAVNVPPAPFPRCDDDSVYKLLNKIPYTYSITPDYIPAAFVRKIAHIIVEPLENLYNLSML